MAAYRRVAVASVDDEIMALWFAPDGLGDLRYLAGETLEEKYWMVVLGLVALTGPSINYLISTSRSNATK